LPLAARDVPDCPELGDYEVLGELGRGGMGVVYKARHLTLDRIVALKVIRTGSADLPRWRERFRREARTVAALSHPHIVHLYDWGEPDGVPYFALEFCDAGSLAERLTGTPLLPRDAATLLETLARTMEHTHKN